MKFKAIILSLCFAVYFIDTLAVAATIKMDPDKKMCCKKMMSKHKIPTKCPEKPNDCTKDCFNCPLLYVTTLSPFVFISTHIFSFERKYYSSDSIIAHGYHPTAWKPPNFS